MYLDAYKYIYVCGYVYVYVDMRTHANQHASLKKKIDIHFYHVYLEEENNVHVSRCI